MSLTSTGVFATSLTQPVIIFAYSGTWPTAAPIPRSLIPCGQPKFSSRPSAPESSARLTMSCQTSRFDSTMSEATTACFGQRFLTSAISRKFSSMGRSEMSSMLLKPIMRTLWRSIPP